MANFIDRERFMLDIHKKFGTLWFSAADVLEAVESGDIVKTERWLLNDQLGRDQVRSLSRHFAHNPDFLGSDIKVKQRRAMVSMWKLNPLSVQLAQAGEYVRAHQDQGDPK